MPRLPGKSCAPFGRFASIREVGPRYARPVIAGGVVIVVVMLLVLPVAVMLGGAVWSALMGWLLVDDADRRAAPAAAPEQS